MEKGVPPPPFPAVRTVVWCALLAGCVTAAYCIHSTPCFIQCPYYLYPGLDAAALPHWLLWWSKAQVAAAALSLLLAGRARRALAFLALAATVASLVVVAMLVSVFTTYYGATGYGVLFLMALQGAEGFVVGVFLSVIVLIGFAGVFFGQN